MTPSSKGYSLWSNKSQFTLSELENNKEKKQNFSLDYYKDRVNQQKTVTFAMDISGSMDGILGEEFDAADYILGLMKEKSGYCVAMTSFNSASRNCMVLQRILIK